MFRFNYDQERISIKHNDGELPYTEKSLQLETIEYKDICINGFNRNMNVKEQFIIPKVFNINRLTIIKCVVDLSTLQGNFGTVEINRCSIIGSLTENLFANIFSVSIYDVLDIKFSQLIDGRIKKIDIQLNNIQQDLELRGANSKYGRLGCLCFYSKCVVNLAKLEGYWNYVEMSDCYFDKRIQINTFGAKTLCFYQPPRIYFNDFLIAKQLSQTYNTNKFHHNKISISNF
ncbi:Hypothetical_protein [Hexamita inflata]|uniref:Hypothetical_protein n=1 Tax=Hexamita inflata TaxID=28002 RepID=A0AA86QEE6_9EUKA|nr:Hypothetical protein HINF_LOCUS42956 [Hexamita inflata]